METKALMGQRGIPGIAADVTPLRALFTDDGPSVAEKAQDIRRKLRALQGFAEALITAPDSELVQMYDKVRAVGETLGEA